MPRSLLAAALAIALATAAGAQVIPDGAEASEADGEPLAAASAETLEEEAPDAPLEERLERTFRNLTALRGVEVEVGAGVVRLSGRVASSEAREQAVAIVRRQPAVVAVDDRLDVSRDLASRLAPVREKLSARLDGLLTLLPLALVALGVLFLAWLLARWVGTLAAPFRRVSHHRFGQDLARQATRWAILLIGLLLALEVMGATPLVGAVLGTAGLIGLALGFAFRDMAENTIASILLSVRQPFAPGDHVVIEEHEGKIVRLNSRATILMTLDGNHLRIPNSTVFKGITLNYTRNPQRRLAVEIGLGTGEDAAAALAIGAGALATLPGVLADPAPVGYVTALGESALDLVYFAWIDQREVDFLKTRSAAVRAVKEALEAAGLDLPEPTMRVRLERRDGGAGREAVSPPRPRAPSPASEDLSPDRHLDQTIAEERAAGDGEDLLDPARQRE